ncbi:hypothetical protein GE061_001462 [Apolygus lucorum]|uniref:Uncharacterized protein n=1 Tax=Apolygus lucorum TaxID=248454 RepID=A0A8S9Y954_APOLU|nr:hypothetical protein GE061_001462 [Apolygus lucorum]
MIDEKSDLDSEDDTEVEPSKVLKLKNNDGFISKRTKSKIIRFVRFNIETHEDDFYREQLMLFLPWLDEESELICVNQKNKFNENKQMIIQNRKLYTFNSPNEQGTEDFIDEDIREHNENEISNAEVEEDTDTVAPNPEDGYEVLRDRTDEGDVFYDGGFGLGNEKTEEDFVPVPYILPEERYLQVVRSLNDKQQRYHYMFCIP